MTSALKAVPLYGYQCSYIRNSARIATVARPRKEYLLPRKCWKLHHFKDIKIIEKATFMAIRVL